MTDELFPAESVRMDSPKLAWLKRHGVLTWYDSGKRDGFHVCPAEWFAGFQHWWPGLDGIIFFSEETGHNGDSRCGQGDTEDEAICSLLTCGEARAKGIKLWNEETA